MEAINLKKEALKLENLHEYLLVATMNNHNFTLVKAKRTLDWHTHPDSDEVFMVLEGKMKVEFRKHTVELNEGEMCVVPKGVEHRPICETEVTCMLIEKEDILTPNNSGSSIRSWEKNDTTKRHWVNGDHSL